MDGKTKGNLVVCHLGYLCSISKPETGIVIKNLDNQYTCIIVYLRYLATYSLENVGEWENETLCCSGTMVFILPV